jgi:hypothetical protein
MSTVKAKSELVQQGAKIVVPYPGSDMQAVDVLALAEVYYHNSQTLLPSSTKPKSSPPFRLLIIHAIELYLNAFLLTCGKRAEEIRGLQHDLAKRESLAQQSGLQLKKKTAAHLRTLSANREYLVSRYGSCGGNNVSQPNRLQATLEEVRKKVTLKVKPTS